MDLAGICNLALQRIGTRTTVSLAELTAQSSNEAIQFNIAASQTRDELLRLAPWDCARGMIDLQYITSLPGTPENQSTPTNQLQWVSGLPLPPWTYEYGYPSDCLRALWVVPQFNPGIIGTPIYPVTTSVGYSPTWQGPPIKFDTGNDLFYPVTAAAVVSGGSGYVVGDSIILGAGPITSAPVGLPATLSVTGVSGGAVTSVGVVGSIYGEDTAQSGGYFTTAIGTQAQGSTSGSGTGATFNLTFGAQGQQRVILTNQEFATLSYCRRITDPNVMDSLFVKAWYHAIAAAMVMALTGDKGLANGMVQVTNGCIAEARAVDANEALTVNDMPPDWLRCRGINYSDYWAQGTGYGWDNLGLWPTY